MSINYTSGAFEYIAETGEVKFTATPQTVEVVATDVTFSQLLEGVNVKGEETTPAKSKEQQVAQQQNIDPLQAALAAAENQTVTSQAEYTTTSTEQPEFSSPDATSTSVGDAVALAMELAGEAEKQDISVGTNVTSSTVAGQTTRSIGGRTA